jgi:hypothetical protein
MIEVPYNELIPGNNYYITKESPEHRNIIQFGKFTRTDNKPNGDAWTYFNDVKTLHKNIETLHKTNKANKTIKSNKHPIVFVLHDADIYKYEPNLQEWHFYEERANPIQSNIYKDILKSVLKDSYAVEEYSKYIPKTRISKKGGKRTRKNRKTKRK